MRLAINCGRRAHHFRARDVNYMWHVTRICRLGARGNDVQVPAVATSAGKQNHRTNDIVLNSVAKLLTIIVCKVLDIKIKVRQ